MRNDSFPLYVLSLTLDFPELLDLSKTITGGNNGVNATQIWTLILGVLLGEISY